MVRVYQYGSIISFHFNSYGLLWFSKFGLNMLNGHAFFEQKDPDG